MPSIIRKDKLRKTLLVLVFFSFVITSYIFAADNVGANKQEELTALQLQARSYRDEGLRAQDRGDLDAALQLYQKALELDTSYPIVYNDLGVLYEAKGMLDRAEDSYLKAIKTDPYYLSTYSNLALFYENKRQLGRAAYCWRKRAELGNIDDPWTQKARQRLEDIRLALSSRPAADAREKDVVGLMKDVANEKYVLRHDEKAQARKKFEQAKLSYGKDDYASAVRDALDAQYMDPDNKDIQDFIEKAQRRALTR